MDDTIPTTARCPCCGQVRDLVSETPLRRMAAGKPRPFFIPDEETLFWAAAQAVYCTPHTDRSYLHWACNHCLAEGRALPADLSKQTFCDAAPFYAYFDTKHVCQDCRRTFVFSAAEKRFWYEELSFWVQSEPRQCPRCRQHQRDDRAAARRLTALMNQLDENDPMQLLEAATLHRQLQHTRSATELFNRSRNCARRREELDLWATRARDLGWTDL